MQVNINLSRSDFFDRIESLIETRKIPTTFQFHHTKKSFVGKIDYENKTFEISPATIFLNGSMLVIKSIVIEEQRDNCMIYIKFRIPSLLLLLLIILPLFSGFFLSIMYFSSFDLLWNSFYSILGALIAIYSLIYCGFRYQKKVFERKFNKAFHGAISSLN